MKITIKDATGDLVSINIKRDETFGELNQRIKEEYGLHIDFSNLQDDERVDLDQNILNYLYRNNEQSQELNREFLNEEEKIYPIETALYFEEILEALPESYELTTLDPEIEEIEGETLGIIKVSKPKEGTAFSDVKFEFTSAFCRLCASRCNDMIYIFGTNDDYKNILKKIKYCLAIEVRKTDFLPKKVCHPCLEKLELFSQFQKTVKQAEKKLILLREGLLNNISKTEDYSQILQLNRKNVETNTETTTTGNKILITDSISESNVCNVVNDSQIPCSSVELMKEDGINNTVENILVKEEAFDKREANCKMIRCQICQETFQTAKKCHIHSSIHSLLNYYPCSLCNKSFTTEEDCNEHSLEHTELSKGFEKKVATHVCLECGKRFVSEGRLKFHQIYHDPAVKSCYCEKCNKVMASESLLYQHMLTVHTQYKQYCCDICGKQFRAQAQLETHQRKHNNDRPFECSTCNKKFYSNDILRRHKKLHLPDKPYQCDQCGKRFDRNNTLTKHLLRHQVEAGQSMKCCVCKNCRQIFFDNESAQTHLVDCNITGVDNDNQIQELHLKEIYRCEFCDKFYTDIQFMKYHRASHNESMVYVCTICSTTYATYNQVIAHKLAHRKSSKTTTEVTIPRYFVCEYCDKQFLHFTNMNIHRRRCSSSKTWMCRYCGDAFQSARELSRHKKGEDGNDTWFCNECHVTFGSICGLEIHRENHGPSKLKDKKKYSCSYCEKAFAQKAHLTIHVRSHTGERPYNCDLCNKSYKIKTERDNHRRTHTGEKPFKCSICEKKFANTARLREHTRFHSEKRPYNCSFCNQSFKKANARNVHITIHTGEKPYQCDICGTNFRRTGDMRKHKRTQHEKNIT